MAFYMFHQRLLMMDGTAGPVRDGTNVLMRYTLRMLTTQQFQRAASLICAMEFLRRDTVGHGMGQIPGGRFSLGLWIGGDGSPNKVAMARRELNAFRDDKGAGQPAGADRVPMVSGGDRSVRLRSFTAKGLSAGQWKATPSPRNH